MNLPALSFRRLSFGEKYHRAVPIPVWNKLLITRRTKPLNTESAAPYPGAIPFVNISSAEDQNPNKRMGGFHEITGKDKIASYKNQYIRHGYGLK